MCFRKFITCMCQCFLATVVFFDFCLIPLRIILGRVAMYSSESSAIFCRNFGFEYLFEPMLFHCILPAGQFGAEICSPPRLLAGSIDEHVVYPACVRCAKARAWACFRGRRYTCAMGDVLPLWLFFAVSRYVPSLFNRAHNRYILNGSAVYHDRVPPADRPPIVASFGALATTCDRWMTFPPSADGVHRRLRLPPVW